MAKRHFKRIVLKLSGEALAGDQGFGINPDVVEKFAQEIAALAKSTDLEIAIVVGGGNLWRGLAGSNRNQRFGYTTSNNGRSTNIATNSSE